MTSDARHEALIADLRALAAPLTGVDSADLAGAVMARLAAEPEPAGRPGLRSRLAATLARRRRQLLVALMVVLLGLLGVPPVRAAVRDWFGFDGVQVRLDPARTPLPVSSPTAAGQLSLARAAAAVSFTPMTLTALGPPDGVEVSPDRRLLSLTWTGPGGRVIRLDQFAGRLDYAFAKTATGVRFTTVGDTSALWFDGPHDVVVLDAAGHPRTETSRTAGPTLIWEQGDTVLRLEGDLALERALMIAGSAAAAS